MIADLSVSDMTTQHDSLKKGNVRQRFLVNVSSNIAFILAQTITHLWLIPFLIGHLGIAVFGIDFYFFPEFLFSEIKFAGSGVNSADVVVQLGFEGIDFYSFKEDFKRFRKFRPVDQPGPVIELGKRRMG